MKRHTIVIFVYKNNYLQISQLRFISRNLGMFLLKYVNTFIGFIRIVFIFSKLL